MDAAAHRIVDLLEDPSADALVDWLVKHPGIEVSCRDRDGVYASAARRGAPEAVQVADRWHLVHNLADALERFAVRVLAAVRRELKAGEAASSTAPDISPSLKGASLAPCRLKERTERRHAEIHELLAQGLTISAISRRLTLHRKTVYRFAAAEVAADLLGRGRRATALDPYLPYLANRWREGQHVAAFLFDEIRKKGYRGSKRSVRRQVADWRTVEPPPPAHAMLPGPRTLAWLLLRRPSDLDEKDHLLLNQLYERSAELVTARRLSQQFLRLVRERRGRELDEWVTEVRQTGPAELRGFSRNLQHD